MPLDAIYTIGFAQKSLRQFVGLLRDAGVDGIVDVRLNNISQLAGFAKRDDLAFILETFAIDYLEEKRLAPPKSMLDRYHRDHDWHAYEPDFERLVIQVQPLDEILTAVEARHSRPCLLCAEPEPDHCHRRLLAEAFQRLRPGLAIHHLSLGARGRHA
jgi:uncharacterized protein (DUF488 family)